ncbi:MAG: prolipoprotein diacylglyceryl transferase family protein [Myxococcota bacterium]
MRYRLMQWIEPWVGEPLAAILIPDQPALSTIGGGLAVLIAMAWSRRDGLLWWKALLAGAAGALCGPVGGRLLWALSEWRLILDHPIALIHPFQGGAASFGALFGAVLGASLALKFLREPIWPYADVLGPPALLGIAFARIGCVMRGCDFGRVSQVPWSIRHSSASRIWRIHVKEGLVESTSPLSAPIHPFPLYLAAWGAVCLALVWWSPRVFGAAPGQRATGVGALWCAGRFVIEFVRHPGDAPQLWGPLNLGHGLALVGCIALWSLNRWLGRRDAEPGQPEQQQEA